MVNDAQVQSPPNLDVRGEERTNEQCDVNRSVKILEYKVGNLSDEIVILFTLWVK